ncbi:MAG TPA: Hsp70 family protein [Xanthobacteraceae bacterium]|nr:Hsp70 family protein [Xanthobacteraceae bacterium]
MSFCGLDFGTSNTALGTFDNGVPVLTLLEARQPTIPSAIFFERDSGEALIGRRAIDAYVDGTPGRLMRSLKSVLGTSLIDETTSLWRKRVKFRDVIATYLDAVKRRGEQAAGRQFDRVVLGRPVHFVDNSPGADRKAEETLREIACGIGFKDVRFQFEPIAAALDYERQVSGEEIALIADIGGGTSDFSIVRLSPERHLKVDRKDDILANDGVRIGGTDFDRRLNLGSLMPLLGYGSAMKRAGLHAPAHYFYDLATWSSINRMYEPRVITEIRQLRREASQPELLDRLLSVLEEQRGHSMAIDVERAKIALSELEKFDFSLEWIEPGLSATISRADFVAHTMKLAARIGTRIKTCLQQARLAAEDIDAVFLTGGSVRMPHVRGAILAGIPAAQVVDGDAFGAVGRGLTIEAERRFGRSVSAVSTESRRPADSAGR